MAFVSTPAMPPVVFVMNPWFLQQGHPNGLSSHDVARHSHQGQAHLGGKDRSNSHALHTSTQGKEETIPTDATATDEPTTMCFKSLPNTYNRTMILQLLDSYGLSGSYDFVFVPHSFKRLPNFVNLGYFFVNFVSHEAALSAWARLDGFKDWKVASDKAMAATWATTTQGQKACIKRFKNSRVMSPHVPSECKPAIFECPPPPVIILRSPSVGPQVSTCSGCKYFDLAEDDDSVEAHHQMFRSRSFSDLAEDDDSVEAHHQMFRSRSFSDCSFSDLTTPKVSEDSRTTLDLFESLRAPQASDHKGSFDDSENSDKDTDVGSTNDAETISPSASADEGWCSTPQLTPRLMPQDATRGGLHEVLAVMPAQRRTDAKKRPSLRRTSLSVLAMVRFQRALRGLRKQADATPRVSLRRASLGVLAMVRMRRALCPVKFAHLAFERIDSKAVIQKNTFIDFECTIKRRPRSASFHL